MRRLLLIVLSSIMAFVSIAWGQGRIWEQQKDIKTRIWGNDSQGLGTAMRWDLSPQIFLLRLPKLTSDYRLGIRDELFIEVVGYSGFSGKYLIDELGEIHMSPLGSIHAADLTGFELEEKIAGLFKEDKLLKHPEVLVSVTDFQSKPFYVLGEVDYPGKYWMMQELSFTEAILLAGGIDFGADQYAYLHRGIPQADVDLSKLSETIDLENDQPGREIFKIDLTEMKEGGVLDPDIPMRPGDLIFVPTRKYEPFYVVGDVMNPGGFEIPKPAGRIMMASQAIAMAGGPTRTAKTKKGILIRYDENGNRLEHKVDFAAILNGKQMDFEVHPKDVIFIPGSKIRTLGYGLLGVVPQAVAQTAVNGTQNR